MQSGQSDMGSNLQPCLIIRADGGPEMGLGHLMRGLALAQGWQDRGGRCLFVLSSHYPTPAARLQQAGLEVEWVSSEPGSLAEARELATLAQATGVAWVAVDGYHFPEAYHHYLKRAGLRLLLLDDLGTLNYYWGDLILNQNLAAEPSRYTARAPGSRLLLGPDYVLLRREFRAWRSWQRSHPERARRLLLTLGGGDQTAFLLRLAAALHRRSLDLEVTVVATTWGPKLQAAAPGWQLVAAGDQMPALMAEADLALAGAGTTCWELAFMELPSLLVVLAANQRRNAELLHQRQAAINLGWHEDLDSQKLVELIQQLQESKAERLALVRQGGRRLVDGAGVDRVLTWLWPSPLSA